MSGLDIMYSTLASMALLGFSPSDAEDFTRQSMYEGVGSDAIDVFDFDQQYFYGEGREFLATMRHTEGFGGAITPCGNSRFYCLTTSIHVAVPKGHIPSSWRYRSMRCQVRKVAGQGNAKLYSIRCATSRTRAVEFAYSLTRGVLSYERKCPECEGRVYRLIKGRGLFARGS